MFLGMLLGASDTGWCQPSPIPPAEDVLTLDEAITLALQDNRSIKNAELDVGKFEDRVAALRTRRLPSFSLNALGTQLLSALAFRFERGAFGNFPATGPIPNQDSVIRTPRQPTLLIMGQVSQPLSQQYRTGLNLAQLKTGQAIAQEQVRAQRQTVVNDVKRAYYAILQTESARRHAEEAIKLYRELDRVTADYVAQQVVLKSENLDVKTRLAKAEYEATNLKNLLASQTEQLNHLLGRDIRTEFRLAPIPEATSFDADLQAAHRRALEQRPEIKEARLKFKEAEYARRIKKSEYIPDVSLVFHYLSPQNVNFVPKTIASAGLMVSWEPFDWGRKKRELAETDRTIAQAKNALHETNNLVLMDVNNKVRKLEQSRQALRVARLAQEAGQEALRVQTNRYRWEASLLKDVLHAQTSLEDANHQYQQALLSFWAARADLEKALGEDL